MKTTLLFAMIATGFTLQVLPAQAQRAEQPDFATLDADGDGLITQEELAAQGAARFAEADTDGDGALSEAELLAQVNARAEDRAARMVERMLEKLDTNEDGLLQQDEAAARGGDRMERRFTRLDANGDGGISAEEFEAVKERGRGGRRGEGRGDRSGRG